MIILISYQNTIFLICIFFIFDKFFPKRFEKIHFRIVFEMLENGFESSFWEIWFHIPIKVGVKYSKIKYWKNKTFEKITIEGLFII
jgi:hypothetical protein